MGTKMVKTIKIDNCKCRQGCNSNFHTLLLAVYKLAQTPGKLLDSIY